MDESPARIAACLEFCRGVPDEAIGAGLAVFVQAKLEFSERIISPKVAKAIKRLKRARV